MRVLVTGAYGLIGSVCLARLHRDGHALTGAGRAIGTARRRFPYAQWIEADFARLTRVQDWMPLIANCDAVVNCVGVLQDGPRDDTRAVHVEATTALFDACAQAGVRRVVHISAMGADAAGPTAFARTKAVADAHLATLDLDWMILRPALVLAPAAYGGSALLRGLAGFPLVTPLAHGDSRVQVVSVNDVAETVAYCLGPDAPAKLIWELVHPQAHRLSEIVAALRGWLGFSPVPAMTMPPALATAVAGGADVLGRLGWRSPARSTALAQLSSGVVGDPSTWMRATGIRPQSLDDILAAQPAGAQERWFARLYLLKPVAIAALALFWIVTGLFAFGPARDAAMAHLTQAGFAPWLARLTVDLGALFDIILGALLCVRRFARIVLLVMLAVTPLYILSGTILAPQLWIDPLGPLTKIVPMLIATLFVLAIIDER
jgi:uncharacterized protein YbjT (DUF2867 family)